MPSNSLSPHTCRDDTSRIRINGQRDPVPTNLEIQRFGLVDRSNDNPWVRRDDDMRGVFDSASVEARQHGTRNEFKTRRVIIHLEERDSRVHDRDTTDPDVADIGFRVHHGRRKMFPNGSRRYRIRCVGDLNTFASSSREGNEHDCYG